MNNLFEKWHETTPFGMFIHWGLYAKTKYHEQYLMRTRANREEYENLINSFNPTDYDAEKWVLLAKNAGMKYICFTVKHHDGFCLWDTKATSYNIMNTPYKKDVLKELQLACNKHQMKLALYYSVPDWHNGNAYNPKSTHQIPPRDTDVPDMEKYKLFVKEQLVELLTNYGKIHTFFWDIPPRETDYSINEFIRKLQPDILINNRGFDKGDFATPERSVPEGNIFDSPTEANQSIGRQSWGYRINEDYYSSNFLKASIDKIMAMGGNYLLNIGPDEKGNIPTVAVDKLAKIGDWFNKIKESFEGTKPKCLFKNNKEWLTTVKDNTIYVHIYNGLTCSGIVLDPIASMPKEVKLLNGDYSFKVALDVIPTYYQRDDWATPYLHIYDLPCDELNNEPIVLKITLNDSCNLEELFSVSNDGSEARF